MTISTRVTIITGASRGLGFALTKALLANGPNHIVYLAARSHTSASTACTTLYSPNAHPIELDISSPTSIHTFTTTTLPTIFSTHTTATITLVNNAAVFPKNSDATPSDAVKWEITHKTNILGLSLLCKSFLAAVKDANHTAGARIINLTSGLGNRGAQLPSTLKRLEKLGRTPTVEEIEGWNPGPEVEGEERGEYWRYNLSKHLVNYLTEVYAVEGKDLGVAVVGVDPGWCRTDMGGAEATLSPEEGTVTSTWLINMEQAEFAKRSGKEYHAKAEVDWKNAVAF
ncbi:hypothetical protein HDV00_006317 [Rhizophlyctis rosea]|nr:hypothetical protein HDV00_006317 [Rhizophlyctis rosea]